MVRSILVIPKYNITCNYIIKPRFTILDNQVVCPIRIVIEGIYEGKISALDLPRKRKISALENIVSI